VNSFHMSYMLPMLGSTQLEGGYAEARTFKSGLPQG